MTTDNPQAFECRECREPIAKGGCHNCGHGHVVCGACGAGYSTAFAAGQRNPPAISPASPEAPLADGPCCEAMRRLEAVPGDATTLYGWMCPIHRFTVKRPALSPAGELLGLLTTALERIAECGELSPWGFLRGGNSVETYKCHCCQTIYDRDGACDADSCPASIARKALARLASTRAVQQRDGSGIPEVSGNETPGAGTVGERLRDNEALDQIATYLRDANDVIAELRKARMVTRESQTEGYGAAPLPVEGGEGPWPPKPGDVFRDSGGEFTLTRRLMGNDGWKVEPACGHGLTEIYDEDLLTCTFVRPAPPPSRGMP